MSRERPAYRPVKHSVTLAGHRTTVSLEDEFWSALRDIAAAQDVPINTVVAQIDRDRNPQQGLASALRLFVLDWFRQQAGSN